MITKIYNKIGWLLGAALLTINCSLFTACDSELDIEKHGNLGSMDTYYTTDDNVNSATASLYLELRSLYFNWYFTKNCLTWTFCHDNFFTAIKTSFSFDVSFFFLFFHFSHLTKCDIIF